MKKKIVIIVVVLVLVLAVGGYFLWKKLKDNKDSKEPETTPEEAKQQAQLIAAKTAIAKIIRNPLKQAFSRVEPKIRISEPQIQPSPTTQLVGTMLSGNSEEVKAIRVAKEAEINKAMNAQLKRQAVVREIPFSRIILPQ